MVDIYPQPGTDFIIPASKAVAGIDDIISNVI
jgi:hypothetical protein